MDTKNNTFNLPGYVMQEGNEQTRYILGEALKSGASIYLTICEQLRFIYDAVLFIEDQQLKNNITEKLIDAFGMAKKMNSRLAYYKKKYNNDRSGSRGSNLIKLEYNKEREHLRNKRLLNKSENT